MEGRREARTSINAQAKLELEGHVFIAIDSWMKPPCPLAHPQAASLNMV